MSNLNGLLLVDKDPGMTSHDVVARARKILGTKSIGHAGTLDPIADGLLVLLVGEATKLSNFVLQGDKGYVVTIQLGTATDSFDISGEVVENRTVNVSMDQISAAVSELTGEVELEVPVYSAVKVDGRRLYKDAHQGRDVVAPKRMMKFYELEILGLDGNILGVNMRTSKGSYVRSWVHTLGKKLGTGACVKTLRRTWSAPYSVENAVKLARLEGRAPESPEFIPMSETLPDWPGIVVDGHDRQLLVNGQISMALMGRLRLYGDQYRNRGVKAYSVGKKQLLALLTVDDTGKFSIGRVFPQNSPG